MEERAKLYQAHIKDDIKTSKEFENIHEQILSFRKDCQKRRSFNLANEHPNPKSTERIEFSPKQKK